MQNTQVQKTTIEWLSFGPEAFAKAKQEQKPVFLHIGFPSCHWCHVMETESFHNPQIIEILNSSFICVDVDREKRPDVDAVYMAACQAMTGQGGWPLTALLTPAQQPFFITTYMPPDALIKLLTETKEQWPKRRDQYASFGARLATAAREQFGVSSAPAQPEKRLMANAVRAYRSQFDQTYGGTGIAPKFPMPQTLTFLLRHGALSGDEEALGMADKTLERMCEGGIFDHVGGGFMRYSTDRRWAVPHFEKMLIDNALLAGVYLEAWQITERPLYHDVAERVLSYVLREMTDAEGGFFGSQDADAKGREGAYYELTRGEMISLLGREDGEAFATYYRLDQTGIPNRIGHAGGISTRRMAALCERVAAFRAERMPLYRDEKILTAWNGMMISSLAQGYVVTGQRQYLEAATAAARSVRKRLSKPDGSLYISWHNGEAQGEGLLDDYAFLAGGCLSLYRATLDNRHLNWAVELSRLMLEKFEDPKGNGFFMTPRDGEKLLARPRDTADSAYPSGNSMALSVLVTLSMLDIGEGWTEAATRQAKFMMGQAADNPLHHMAALTAALPLLHAPTLLHAHAGPDDLKRILSALIGQYKPLLYLKASKPGASGRSFHLCKGKACYPPFQEIDACLAEL